MTHATIAAIATPQGMGGIGIVRLSGPKARAIAARVFSVAGPRKLEEVPGYTALFGRVHDGEDIDEAVALVFRAPKSYTGEDVVELSCHGGMYIVKRLLSAVLSAGAAAAGPGEFTKRAFLNGKLGLTQAESVMDLIGAQGAQAARTALAAHDGVLGRRIDKAKDSLVALAAHLSAFIDYPEDDIPALEDGQLDETLSSVSRELRGLLDTFEAGKAIREGVDTVIAGRPNVGKSTLMNLLAGSERSIVTHIPGTTRDVVEETVRLGNVLLRLADTAGLRETDDPVESIGVDLARSRLASAGLVLAVFDSSEPLQAEDRELLAAMAGRPSVAVVNKTDLPSRLELPELSQKVDKLVTIAAGKGKGADALALAVEEVLGTAQLDPAAGILMGERQKDCARRALDAVEEAREAASAGMTLDALSVSVDGAIDALLELTGQRTTDAVVDQVFARFCVGK